MLWLGTCRHRPAWTPTSCPDGGGSGPATATFDRLSNWAVSAWLLPMPIVPTVQVVSVMVATVVASICAVIVLPENVRARVCQVFVPSAATVPLLRTVLVLFTLL